MPGIELADPPPRQRASGTEGKEESGTGSFLNEGGGAPATMLRAVAHPRPAGEDQPWIGRPLRRIEDARFATGGGRFVDDHAPENCLQLEFVRSPYASGAIDRLDLDAARSAPGVVAVLSGADVAGLGHAAVNPLVQGLRAPGFPILASAQVSAAGQAVAAVIAHSASQARDAAELAEIKIGGSRAAGEPGSRQAFADRLGTGKVDAAFAAAYDVVEVVVQHSRVAPAPLEPRAALAIPDETGGLTVYLSTQTPHRARADLATILGLSPDRIRVIAPDVGGAFGGKASIYPEDVVVALAAHKLGRPVKWCAARSEEFLSATHGRGGTLRGALALDRHGRFLALKAEIAFPLGHWMPYSGAVPARNAARILPGPYRVPLVDVAMRGEITDTAPMGIYRGAGRPEAAMLMERLVDEAARATRRDPAELRRLNLLHPTELPALTPTGERLDAGDYPGLLREAGRISGYHALLAERDRRRHMGEMVGLGLALYVEPCGQGWEGAALRLAPDGRIIVETGSTAQGQGRETAFAQIAANALGVAPDRVVVRQGDTAEGPDGIGALASRSTAIGGSALTEAAEAFRAEARALAATLLQVPLGRVGSDPDGFFVQQDPLGAHLGWLALAEAAEGDGLAVSLRFEAPGEAWAAGCCLAFVAIDPDTGALAMERLFFVDDAGTVVNPMLVEGQLIGGAAQGIGEALLERIVYDEAGQMITGSLMDYALPRAADIPPITLGKHATASAMNPLGVKGVGEAGCIGIPAAIVNAAVDALAPFGIRHLDMPLTSEKIWRAMRNGVLPCPNTPDATRRLLPGSACRAYGPQR